MDCVNDLIYGKRNVLTIFAASGKKVTSLTFFGYTSEEYCTWFFKKNCIKSPYILKNSKPQKTDDIWLTFFSRLNADCDWRILRAEHDWWEKKVHKKTLLFV